MSTVMARACLVNRGPSSFKNTDLDWQLRQRNITDLVFAGLVANTCIETTARMANEE
jgi:nicotinamidase-related amidase